jgi:hypothetical protein
MAEVVQTLVMAGINLVQGGFMLWIVLFLVALARDPQRGEVIAWSVNTQWAATLRLFRRAAGFPVWGRLASGMIALGLAVLIVAGLLTVVRLIAQGPAG